MKKDSRIKLGGRLVFIQFVLLLGMGVIGMKSLDVQILKGEFLTRKAEQGYSRHLTIKGHRGQILDRHMNKLGSSIDAPTITADPTLVSDPKATAKALAMVLDLKTSDLEKKLTQDRRYVELAHRVSLDEAAAVRELNLRGIFFKSDAKRVYPNRNLAAQVIGFTGKDDTGLEGLEYRYNAVLAGTQIQTRVMRDGSGRILDIDKKKQDELRGNSLVLTLDRKIQFLSEKTLEQTVKEFNAKAGMALVMRPATGELLAVANYPGFNPNNYGSFDKKTYRNRAVSDVFEPGSLMKVFTVAAALETGVAPKSIYFCENGKYKIGRYTVHDTKPHDWLSLGHILKYSSNIGSAKVVETIGNKALHNYLTQFGFGEKTRIGMSGEGAGVLMDHGRWTQIDAAAISFGQGVSATGLQLVTALSAIANDGQLMQPMLIKKIISPEGKTLESFSPTPVRQVISPMNAAIVKAMMNQVVQEDGTGTRAAMEGYAVCGKTSTAQKPGEKGYAKNKYIAAFGGFAPQKDPELAVLVVIDEPRKQHYGGIVAAPAFKTIMAQSFNYLNIPPDTTATMIAGLAKEADK